MSLECQVNEVSNPRTENFLPCKSFFKKFYHILFIKWQSWTFCDAIYAMNHVTKCQGTCRWFMEMYVRHSK